MKKIVLGVVAGVALTMAVIAAGLYYVYEKGKAKQAERQASVEQERQGAVSQFGTTCENANAKIAAFVYNELKSGLSALSAEGQGKDELHSSLVASIEKYAVSTSGSGLAMQYVNARRPHCLFRILSFARWETRGQVLH